MKARIRIIIIGAVLLLIAYYGSSSLSHFFYSAKDPVILPYTTVLGSEAYGNVVKEGPYGNASSTVKVAYIVGVHPLEDSAHEAALKAIKTNSKSLKYCYYIYRVNVTQDAEYYVAGRMNGQILASDYVVPDIEKDNFQLVIDVHSNRGPPDLYDESWFLNVPFESEKTLKLSDEIMAKIPGLTYYDPPEPTSPYFITIPLLKEGIPTIIYEEYVYDTPENKEEHAKKLLLAIESLNLKYPVEHLA
jgi:hypothetical protein